MKTEKFRLNDYVLFKISGTKGNFKIFSRDDINGGLQLNTINDPNTYPLKCIPIYVKGSFNVYMDGKYVTTRHAPFTYDRVTTETWENCFNQVNEDDSIYFCVYKKQSPLKYLNRKIITKEELLSDDSIKNYDVIVCDLENPYIIHIENTKSKELLLYIKDQILVKVWE